MKMTEFNSKTWVRGFSKGYSGDVARTSLDQIVCNPV